MTFSLYMAFPDPTVLEQLVPELARLANSPKSSQQQIDNFATLIQTATLRWLIERSLYERESDFFLEIESEWFDCATWLSQFLQKIPNGKEKTLKYYLLGEYTNFYQNKWQKAIITRYQITPEILDDILNLKLFSLTDKSLRNNFNRLSKIENPKLIKAGHTRGKYKKQLNQEYQKTSTNQTTQNNFLIEENNWDFLNPGVSAIAELLLMKINGSQRFFWQTEYIFQEEVQEIAEDWADKLREIWQSHPVLPIKIKYYSASQNTTNHYIVYPVCLQYYQRAYYLSAAGESPDKNVIEPIQWYNYRLDRILDLEELTWDFSDITQLLKNKIYDLEQLNYIYTPDYIQEQLDLAYGFDFYRNAKTMLLRFDSDYDQRYIKNTIRHATFQKISTVKKVKKIITTQLSSNVANDAEKQQLINIVEKFSQDAYYQLNYREADHNVMMRLLSWGANVEVILPLTLRQAIKHKVKKTWQIYQ